MRHLGPAAALAVLLSGCASIGGPPGPAPGSIAAARGLQVAQSRCAVCHALGEVGPSPRPAAPPFGTLRVRYNEIAWERIMAAIGRGGHDEMPPVALSEADVHDLQAYIRTIR